MPEDKGFFTGGPSKAYTKKEIDERPPSKRDLSGEGDAQAKDIAGRTSEAERSESRSALKAGARSSTAGNPMAIGSKLSGGPPESTSPHYAVEGLKGHVEQGMKEQGEEATTRATGRTYPPTKIFFHGGE